MYINNQHARGSKVFHEFTQVRIALIVANWSYDEVIIHKVTDDVGAGNILHIHLRQCVQTTSDIVRLRSIHGRRHL